MSQELLAPTILFSRLGKAAAWRRSLERKPHNAKKFYGVLATAMTVGLAIDFAGLDAVKMLFWSAVVTVLLAPLSFS